MRKKSSTLLFAALVGPQGAPNIEIKNLRLIESQQSQKHFELAANTGQVFRDQKLVALDKVLGAIYSTPGNPFQIQGESGLLSSESNDFQIRDSVVITSPDNYRIETNDIDYNSDERILSTDEKVTLKTQTGQAQELSLEAQGLRVITRLHQYELLQDVVAQQAQAGGRLTIRSRSAVLNPQQSLSSFIGSAQLNSKDMKLRGDRLEIQMSQGSQRIEKILMVQKESEFVRVSLPSIEVESKGFQARFSPTGELLQSEAIDNARAETSDGVKIEAQRLIFLPTVSGQQRLKMEGQVRLEVQGRRATCEEAEMDPVTGDILLKRFATVERSDQKISGAVIRLSTKNSFIDVEGAEGQLQKSPIEINSFPFHFETRAWETLTPWVRSPAWELLLRHPNFS